MAANITMKYAIYKVLYSSRWAHTHRDEIETKRIEFIFRSLKTFHAFIRTHTCTQKNGKRFMMTQSDKLHSR